MSSRTLTEKLLPFLIVQGSIPAFSKEDLARGASEDTLAGFLDPDQAGHRPASPGNDDLFAHPDALDEPGKMGLGLMDIHFHTRHLS